jgi:hypothetical protein
MDMIGFHRVVESSVSFFVSEMGFCGDRMHEGWVGVRVGVGDCCGRACRVCMDLLDGLSIEVRPWWHAARLLRG